MPACVWRFQRTAPLKEGYIMNIRTNASALVLSAVGLAVTALVVSCGGGGGSNTDPPASAKAATLDMAGVTAGIAEISAVFPICSTVSPRAAAQYRPVAVKAALLARAMELPQARRAASSRASRQATQPADTLGSCGGRMTYSAYSHVNGVTTATRAFENYCTTDSSSGEQQIINGSFDFVDTGTPGASGPITSKVTASSAAGLTFVTKDSTGKVLTSQGIGFTNFLYTVGVPGGNPTQAQPSSFGFDEFSITDKLTNKTYRESGYKVTFFEPAAGGQQYTMSGRGYRSNGDYFDVSTQTPMLTDASGNTVSGTLAFTGGNGSTAIATFVPGAVNQATMTVNGAPVTGMPACK